jgi:two-component system, cell cycle sensor histidine kinase and response regulator CckA
MVVATGTAATASLAGVASMVGRAMSTDDISRMRAELEALRLEKESLANQVKRLVQAESKLYAYQELLDAQLKEYQDLYELNRKLSLLTYDLPTVFKYASSYVIDSLGYERVIFLREGERPGNFEICAVEGYYDEQEKEEVRSLTIAADDPLVAPLFNGDEYRGCSPGCNDATLTAFGDRIHMREYLVYLIGSHTLPLALLILGNSAENVEFYRRVVESESLPGIGNLVGLLSSTMEKQLLYASMDAALEQERVAEAKYRGIFENAVEGIYQSSPDGRLISCNPATAAILGYSSPQEALHSIGDVSQLYVDPRRHAELFEILWKGVQVKDFEVELFRKDGTRVWVRVSVRPCLSDNLELLYLDGIMQDITGDKQREESLMKLSQAVEQSPVTIMITDTRGLIEFVNPKFVQLTGYAAEEVLGKSPGMLKSGQNPPEMYSRLWESLKAGGVWEGEFVNRKKNGELFSERATISPIKNKDGAITHYLAIKEDITERKLLQAQLLQSQKMESVGRLAGGVAHDFNNMLSVIIGCVQLAMLKVEEGDKVWQFLNQILRAAERSSEITRQLLAFSRKEIVSLKRVNINAKILETQNTLGRLIGEDIDLRFKPGHDIWTIEADPSQLDQILVNLAVNARDAMPGGGVLSIETANVQIDPTYCRYHLDARPGDYVQLSVTDSGTGMDAETVAHIFEPFFTTKEVGKGTGLGLAMVYGIIRQNNGFINVYSEVGQGTSFHLHLPRHAGPAEVEQLAPQAELAGSGTVLLVEDDALVREMAMQMLIESGYTVIKAKDPADAIEICRKGEVQIDLILTDVVMPVMNGKEMVDAIEKFRPDIKVLFMSGYTSDLVAQRGVVDSGRHFIQKPFSVYSLNQKIRETLRNDPSSELSSF